MGTKEQWEEVARLQTERLEEEVRVLRLNILSSSDEDLMNNLRRLKVELENVNNHAVLSKSHRDGLELALKSLKTLFGKEV
jgi:archaellum component FlaC